MLDWQRRVGALGVTMKKIVFTASAVMALAMASTAANATTITTLPYWDNTSYISPWGGSGTNTYGEVLVAPGGSLTSYTFEVDDNGLAADYVPQVYAWSGSTTAGGPVGAALYTGAASVLPGVNGFQSVTVNTGGVALAAGQEYDVLLYDGDIGDGVYSEWGVTPNYSHPGVAGDVGFAFNNGPSNVNGTFEDFGSLAYSATFSGGVPEPATWAMMLLGLGGLGVALRSRRRAAGAVATA